MTTDRARTIAGALAAIAGLAITIWFYYPGVMSPDSLGAYRQAVTGVIDGHTKTPLLAFLLLLTVNVFHGASGVLFINATLFWTGLSLCVSACRLGPARSAMLVIGIGLFPTVFALLGTIWSDVLLATSLTLFMGLALLGRTRGSKVILAVALIPLWAGLLSRVNALPAIVPLAAWFVVLWFGTGARPVRVRSRAFVAAWLALVLGLFVTARGFDRLVIDRGSGSYTRSLQFAFFHDLAGIAVHTGDLRLPSRVYRTLPNVSLELMRQVYDPADVNLLIYNPQWTAAAFLTTDDEEFRELWAVWRGAVAAHPGAYIRRRMEAIAAHFQIRGVHYPFHTGIDPNEFGLEFRHGAWYERVTQFLFDYRGWFFRGWAFGLAALAIVVIAVRKRRWSACAVAASGLAYVAPFVLITTGADFRYIWWLVVATLIGALLLAGDRAEQ